MKRLRGADTFVTAHMARRAQAGDISQRPLSNAETPQHLLLAAAAAAAAAADLDIVSR